MGIIPVPIEPDLHAPGGTVLDSLVLTSPPNDRHLLSRGSHEFERGKSGEHRYEYEQAAEHLCSAVHG